MAAEDARVMPGAESFEYAPIKGVHSMWALFVDGEPTYTHYDRLGDVEDAVDDWMDEDLEDREGVDIVRVAGSHGWRTFELSDGSSVEFRWNHAPIDFRCVRCVEDTSDEGYMVHDEIWTAAGFTKGFSCIGCLETAIGRALTSADFQPDVPMNTDPYFRRSPRLRDRLGALVAKPESKPNTTYTAPLGSIDLRAFDDDGIPYEITNCYDCLTWRAEVVHDAETGEIMVREWHAWECQTLQGLLADD